MNNQVTLTRHAEISSQSVAIGLDVATSSGTVDLDDGTAVYFSASFYRDARYVTLSSVDGKLLNLPGQDCDPRPVLTKAEVQEIIDLVTLGCG